MKRSSVDVVLDATYEAVLAVGVRRTTFADVARRAGVSRATLYTHFEDVGAAVSALLTRELTSVLSDAMPAVGDRMHGRAALIAVMDNVLRALPAHPLLARALELDAELLMPYVVQRLGQVQERALEAAIALVEAGQRDRSIRDGDPRHLAYGVLLLVRSAVLAHGVTATLFDADGVRQVLLATIDRGLEP